MTPLTKEQAAILGAFTGILCGPFADIQEYANRVLNGQFFTHQFGDEGFAMRLKEAARADFMAIVYKGAA